jgi:hypothetical protein
LNEEFTNFKAETLKARPFKRLTMKFSYEILSSIVSEMPFANWSRMYAKTASSIQQNMDMNP